jgi:fucose permease
MGLVLCTTVALILWIVLWATGSKSFDGFLVAMVIITLGATVRILKPYLPGRE